MDRVLFGSVAERVIKTSRVPVLVVNPFATE
ncbi:MAG: universal stress protein [Desulfobacterales bacterium]|nr:universal stress protein [Desulfobacterales bacterium]